MKLAFIDLDGVVANSDARFEQAKRPNGTTDWKRALHGNSVHLDTPIDGVKEALNTLEEQGWQIIFLTSRPEQMRPATEQWFLDHDITWTRRTLEMKPLSAQYTKTVLWKAQRLHELAAHYGATKVLVVDDDAVIVAAIMAASEGKPYHIRAWSELSYAVNLLGEKEEGENS